MAEIRSLVVVIRANRRRVGGAGPTESADVEYEMNGAPDWVQKAIDLLIERWGTPGSTAFFNDETTVQPSVCHRVRELAQMYGRPHP